MEENNKNIYSFVVDKSNDGKRLDVFLKSKFPDLSREYIKKEIVSSGVKIGHEIINLSKYKIKENQEIIFSINENNDDLLKEDIEIKILFENNDFLVIDKPAGMVVHPGAGQKTGTLANAILYKYPEMAKIGHSHRPGIVHRLDKDTSGLMLLAKNLNSFEYAKNVFKTRKVTKIYTALVCGIVEEKHGFIEKPLVLDHIRRRVVVFNGNLNIDSEKIKEAKTEYNVSGFYKDNIDFYTLVSVQLHTGRTHQIRVHFSSIGHPIAGDETYGKRNNLEGLKRQFLHASKLIFPLSDGTSIDIESELPPDLTENLENLENFKN